MRHISGLAIVLWMTAAAATTAFATPAQNGQPSPGSGGSSQDESLQWAELRNRFADRRHQGLLSNLAWVLVHTAESKEEVEEFFKLLMAAAPGLERDNPAHVQDIGVSGFKQNLARLTKSKDDTVSGSAAIVLGICGDRGYTADLAELLHRSDSPNTDDEEFHRPLTARGRAAMALGLMGAKEYAPEIASLLRSKNDYDREGAAMGLGYLGDRSYSKVVAALLATGPGRERLEESGIQSLLMMGAASEYADQIAEVLRRDQGVGGAAETSAYALAVIGAREHSQDIAALLKQESTRGYAAKALALMGATEYAKDIEAMLTHGDELARKDGALALGVMRAKEYAAAVSKVLQDKEEHVRYYAAVAVVLMGVPDYDAVAVPIIDKFHEKGYGLNEGDFNPLARDQFNAIKARFEESLARIKKQPQR